MTIEVKLANTIADPRAYGALKPVDDAFTQLRRDNPFDIAEPDGYDPFWVACKHADILTIERQADLFHNGDRSNNLLAKDAIKMARAFSGGESNIFRMLVTVDGAEHRALRAVTFPAFTAKALQGVADDVRKIAREFVELMLNIGPECDFARDIAFLYPLRVVMQILGVPREDQPQILKLTQQLFSNSDPDLNRSGTDVTPAQAMAAINAVMHDLEAYFGVVTQKLRAQPAENINSLIANARIDGQYLTHRQLMGYYILVATAGHDTTSNTTAAALWALAERPEVLAQIKADPAQMNGFVEESIRWATPVKTFMRSATADTELRGRKIAKGDWILLSYHSANRDEEVFENPFDFDIKRKPNKQIAFGSGPHVCLGQHLARMEMRILWEELLPRLKSLELAGEAKWTKSVFVVGPKTVPVRYAVN